MSRDWSAAPPPAFAPPPLVEPPTWAAGFAADAADSAGAGAGQAAPDATEPSREPAAADESDPRLEPEASPEPTSAESESGAAPSAPAPVQDAVDLSAFAAPDGPPSGVITLPPEAWLAELADADRPLSLSPTPDRRSLVDPRLSAAATSDSGYSDDDDGSVDPEDRVVGSWGPTSAATAARALHPDDAPVPSWNAEVELASDAGPDAEPELPAAAAEATTAVAIAARLPRTFGIEFGTTEPAPAEQRAGRAPRLFWLAFAPTASVLLLGIGAGLVAGGASLRQAVVAVIVGAAVSALPISLAVLAGRWSGQPALVTSRAVFGVVGNAVPALLAVLTRVGWAGALLWLTADAAGGVAAAAGLGDAGLIRVVALVAGILLAGSIAVFGYGLLSGVQAAATVVGATAVVAIVALTLPRLDLSAALAVPDGSWSLVVGGAALVVAVGGLALVQSIGDLARYQRSTGAASAHSAAAVAGATLPTVILVGWGALLAASDRDLGLELTTTPIATLTGLLPAAAAIPLLVAVALSGVAGAAVATYSGGLAITAAGVRAPRPLVTVPAALVAALVAVVLLGAKVDASALLRDAAVTLAVPVAAWAGLVGGDLLLRTRRLHTPSLLRRGGIYPDVRPVAIALLVVLTALGWLLVDSSLPGLAWQGGLLPLLGPDAAAARPGVLAALVGGLLAGLLLGLGTVRRQERSVVEPGPADS
ncbi:hypothetical protein FJ656_23550 [Schumannella luteola]|nr:hypothetical protein FJ656_23550 [Schumannella luteola]